MQSLENLKRVQERHAAAVTEAAELARKLEQAQAAWSAAVGNDDAKAEATATKALQAAQDALQAAESRIPLLAASITEARKAALPGHAKEINAKLADLNERARTMAKELFSHYEQARAMEKQIRGLYADHGETLKEHSALCKEVGGGRPPIAEYRFSVNLAHLAIWFRPEINPKYRLSLTELLPTKGGQLHAITE